MVMINTDDGQAVAPDMQVHYAKWKSWEQALREDIAPNLQRAADQLRDNIGLQTEGKWSAESGPQAFATKYKEYLTEEVAALEAMAKNATEFADRISDAMDMLMKNEGDAAGWLDKEAAKIPSVYISDDKQAALDEFAKHPSGANLARLKRYRY
ncbi:MAG: hypothetical protein HXK10_07380 [Actinomyces sp.]|uniref:hypothetical protein n=1 Tax=uncultured Actinomyces sp. TaxID=249061 RepID=UPI001CB50AB6|nr:hypothetical protein [uncultured Actinomyces sp.]MBF0959926.1 hypothetical protein [Actinomyces sp.]